MGNRTSVGFRGPSFGDGTFYLYSHWGFDVDPVEVLNKVKSRWGDDSYAVRRMSALFMGPEGCRRNRFRLFL
jgi:hypothetical protein